MRAPAFLAVLALTAAPLRAGPLQVTKAATVVSDQVSTLNPKALPGATIDYRLTVVNPLLPITAAQSVVVTDDIPPTVRLRVADLGAATTGPVEFSDGLLLGLLPSGVAFRFAGLTSTTDGLDFHDGTAWGYVPTPDADGYDPKVRRVRVTLTGTQAAGTRFQLRYRVAVR